MIMAARSYRLFGRRRSVHQILGGGIFADVILWRRRKLTMPILVGTLSAWLVFEKFGYTLLSFVSNVLLLLMTVLYVWSKAAAVLNRPPPPLPKMQVPEEVIAELVTSLHSCVNNFLSVSHDVALGMDPKCFYKVAACLWLISLVSGLTDFTTSIYTSLIILLTIPAIYEKYEDCIDRYIILGYADLEYVCRRADVQFFSKLRTWILKKWKSC